jgi:hypothetical protein
VTVEALMRKLERAVRDANRNRLFGKIETEFKAGEPVYLREQKQYKLDHPEAEANHELQPK